jgi:hypothetical protein
MRMNKIFNKIIVFPGISFSWGALASRVLLRSRSPLGLGTVT